MNKLIIIVIFFLFGSNLYAAENLRQDDYFGTWETYGPTSVKGEKQKLIINKDYSAYFQRKVNDVLISLNASVEDYNQQEDVLIIKFKKPSRELRYKVVLSGWKSGDTYALYGMMYMYREGKQFNGIPISFRKMID